MRQAVALVHVHQASKLSSARGRGVAGRAVAAGRLSPSRVDDLVDHVDEAVVGLDVGLVGGAGGRVVDVGEGVVDEVLAEHAAVGDLRALDRGEVGAGEAVSVDLALDNVVSADVLVEDVRRSR